MSRYIRKLSRIGSIGPNEERGFAVWVGYDIADANGELPEMINVDGWSDAQLAEYGVAAFKQTTLEEWKRWTS